MNVEHFIDTNVFVYLFDDADRHKQKTASSLIQQSIAEGTACISFQVVQECLNVVVRKLSMPADSARQFFEDVLRPLLKPVVRPYSVQTCRLRPSRS